MRSKAEREQDFEAIKSNLFEAGVSVLKAAQTHQEMFNTALESLADAIEMNAEELPQLTGAVDHPQSSSLWENLRLQRQASIAQSDFDELVRVEEKLQKLEEFDVQRLERQARLLEARLRIQAAQQQLKGQPTECQDQKKQDEVSYNPWTENSLKKRFKNLAEVQKALGIPAKTWKAAVAEANLLW
jgi:hypothetical protein